jgi:hypothetical protein
MSVEDAEPDDIYVDANDKLWRIVSVYHEPTVEAEEVEGTLNDPNVPSMLLHQGAAAAGINIQGIVRRVTLDKRRQKAFTSAGVWFGWRRIFRRAVPAPVEPAS